MVSIVSRSNIFLIWNFIILFSDFLTVYFDICLIFRDDGE